MTCIVVDKTIYHAKPHSICFLPQYQRNEIFVLTIEHTDSDLKVHALHYANDIFVHLCRVFRHWLRTAVTWRKLYICTELVCLHFPNLFWTMTDVPIKRKPIYAYYLLLADLSSPIVKRKLIIIGSHVTVGAPRKRGMFGGVGQNVWDCCKCFLLSLHRLPLLLIFRTLSQFLFLRVSFFFALPPSFAPFA